MDTTLRLNELNQKLHQCGCRVTPQRMAVLKILVTSPTHPSVEQVYDQVKNDFPMTSLGTVYKTVKLLKEMGEILELGFGDDSHRYDGARPYPHPHLICIECNKIIDGDLSLDQESLRSLEQASGYQILRPQISLYVFCPDCKEERYENSFNGSCGNGIAVALFNNGKPPKVFELSREHFGSLLGWLACITLDINKIIFGQSLIHKMKGV